jgi:predicted TPR repeat methyltransferase
MIKDKLQEARNLFQQGQVEKAYPLCKELCKEDPQNSAIHHLYSMVLTQLGDINSAMKHISLAIELAPHSPQLHNNRGNIYLRTGKIDEAIHNYEKAIELDNQYAPAHNNLGNCYFKRDELPKAKEYYLRALHLEPTFADAHFNYARLLIVDHNYLSARYVLLHALELNDKHPAVLGQLAELALMDGDYEDAAEYFSERLKIQPTHADTYHSLGIALYKLGDYENAADAFNYSIELGTSAADAHFNLGNAKIELGQFKEALKNYMQQLEIEANAETYYNIGVILMAQDHHSDALQYFKSVLEKDPNNIETLQNVAAIYLKQGKSNEAINTYRHIIELDPKNDEIRHIIHALSGGYTPERSPNAYVKNLFNHYASYYEKHLQTYLHYDVPDQLVRAIEEETQCQAREQWRILDLGCGTGLLGQKIKHLAGHLTGVDISPNMIQQAERKKIYNDLMIGDLNDIFASQADMDLVVAADVFTYIGDLDLVFERTYQVLKNGGLFAFTVEKTSENDYILQKTIRYAHHKKYLEKLAKNHDFLIERISNIHLRRQHGHPIEGYLVILKKPIKEIKPKGAVS